VLVDEHVSALHGRVAAIVRLDRARSVPVAEHAVLPVAVAHERVAPVARQVPRRADHRVGAQELGPRVRDYVLQSGAETMPGTHVTTVSRRRANGKSVKRTACVTHTLFSSAFGLGKTNGVQTRLKG